MFLRRRLPGHGILRTTKRDIRTRHVGTQVRQLSSRPPIIRIENGTFYNQHPSSGTNPSRPLFKDLNFALPSFSTEPHHWAILGPSATTFLQILRGEHICIPPTARSYPYLNSREIEEKDINLRLPSRAIQYVGFSTDQGGLGGQGTSGAYLSARYESRREATDFSVRDYLKGNTELNALEDSHLDPESLNRVVRDLRLEDLVDMPVSNLSNGQTRRAKIARALLSKPEVLLLDEPFMGLDPPTLMTLSPLLHRLAEANSPRLILTLRPQDPIPDWTTHLLVLGTNHTVALQGERKYVWDELKNYAQKVESNEIVADESMPYHPSHEIGRLLTSRGVIGSDKQAASGPANMKTPALSRDGYPLRDTTERKFGESLIEMDGVRVAYGEKVVLGNWENPKDKKTGLWWTVKRGERWGIFGPNGSGKTTMLSLICSDHPQTYSLPIKLFGRSRLPAPGEPGISIFDIQSRIGHSSPEIHNHFPKRLTVRQTLENAWSETFMGMPVLDGDATGKVESCLRWFEPELRSNSNLSTHTDLDRDSDSPTSWADDIYFRELPFSGQRVALFIRALIKNPDLVILDEAFSGMNETVRDKCMLFLAQGESKTYAASHDTSDSISNNRSGSSIKSEVVDSKIYKAGKTKVWGLQDHQAMICISHLPEEVPGSVREWICLEEANTRRPARVGRLDGPLERDGYRMWNDIWGVGGGR